MSHLLNFTYLPILYCLFVLRIISSTDDEIKRSIDWQTTTTKKWAICLIYTIVCVCTLFLWKRFIIQLILFGGFLTCGLLLICHWNILWEARLWTLRSRWKLLVTSFRMTSFSFLKDGNGTKIWRTRIFKRILNLNEVCPTFNIF